MPYFAPDAPMPITSCAPRLAEMKASPQIQAGRARPARKKSALVRMKRLRAAPMPSTKAKYTSMMVQSMAVRFTRPRDAARVEATRLHVKHPRWAEGYREVQQVLRDETGGRLFGSTQVRRVD